jgi:cytoskeletal protein RodZ
MMQTIGQRLKAEREQRRLTLEKVFQATRIRVQYLQALEEDDLSVMPSPVQARGYLRNYAEYLGFDVDRVLHDLREANALPASTEVVGPADIAVPSPAPDEAVEVSLLAPQSLELDEQGPVEEPAVPVKTKPVRRKKAAGSPRQPKAASPEAPIKQGVREQPQLGPELTAQLAPEAASPDPVAPPEMEEARAEPTTASDSERSSVDTPPEADVSDTLWKTWLTRVGSMVSAQSRRRTLIPREPSLPVNEPVLDPLAPDIPAHVETQLRHLEQSTQIFREIGVELRQRRELLSLHFDEVERNTHVKAHYLEALERGALEDLPSTVQTRGMLANYATFLDLDVDTLLLRFADALQARHRERNPQKPARKPGQPIIANMPPVRSFIAGDMIFGIGMVVLLVGFAIWGVSRVMAIQGQREVQPTGPSISDMLLSTPDPASFTATATFLPVEAFPGEPTVTVEIPTQNVNAPVQLNLVVVERTYMRVTVDGEVEFDGRALAGNAYPFEAESQIEVLVGSGAAIRVVYNGRDLGLMGTFGQVVNNIYLDTEILTPTSLPTTTPTITLTPTRTPLSTATSQFTSTPAPSATAVP